MSRLLSIAALLATISGSAANAAKPAPPVSGTTTPELAFVRITGNGNRTYELRMSNEDGTGASTLYTSKGPYQMMVDLGPRAHQTLLLVLGGKLNLAKYAITSSGPAITSIEQIIDLAGGGGAATAVIAPTGTDIAYLRPMNLGIWRYNLATKQHSQVVGTSSRIVSFDFSPNGQTIYYLEESGSLNFEHFTLKSVSSSGGIPTALGPEGYFVELSASPNGDLYLGSLQGGVERIYRYTPGGGAPEYVTTGHATSVRCDGARFIAQRVEADAGVLIQRDIPAGTENYFSRRDLYWPDYMPTC